MSSLYDCSNSYNYEPESNIVEVTLQRGTTMNSMECGKPIRPKQHEGLIRLACDNLKVSLAIGTQLTTLTGPTHCTWTLGPLTSKKNKKTHIHPVSGSITIPEGTEVVKASDGNASLIFRTEVKQKFMLEEKTTVILPKGTVIHCEEFEVSLNTDTFVYLE